jgi:ABC-type nickel/cobalt efflux system permease component RcnA
VIRALITAALLAGAAIHFFGAKADVAIGYSLVLSLTLWFFWPLLRRIARLARHRRRRHQPSRTPNRAAPAPRLTQINHHHHYYGGVPPGAPAAAMPRPDYSRPALPLRTEGQQAHDAIYDIIDIDDETR